MGLDQYAQKRNQKIDFKKAEQNILEDLWSEAKKKEVKK